MPPLAGPPIIDVQRLAALVARRCVAGEVTVLGITGSVASGKSWLADALGKALRPAMQVELLPTDGFLLPNAELEARGLALRKGFPESYDTAALARTLAAARLGPVEVPGYSHSRYDIDPALTRRIEAPDLLLVEGLGIAPDGADHAVLHALDALLYIDATEEDLEHWFLERFMALWRAAAHDPTSFYARFRTMREAEARGFARTMVWRGINLPNLHEHITRARPHADLLLWKTRDHALHLVRPELESF
jgi:type I pantothenate kinase